MQDPAKLAHHTDAALEDALVAAAQEVVAVRADAEARVAALRADLTGERDQVETLRRQLSEAQEVLAQTKAELATRPAERSIESLIGEQLAESRSRSRRLELEAAEDRRALTEAMDANGELSRVNQGLLAQVEALEERFSDTAASLSDEKDAIVATQQAEVQDREDTIAQLRAKLEFAEQGLQRARTQEQVAAEAASTWEGKVEQASTQTAKLSAEVTDLNTRCELAEQRVERVEAEKAELSATQATLEEFADQESARAAEVASRLAQSEAELAKSRAELAESRAELAESRAELAESRDELAESRAELQDAKAGAGETQSGLRQASADLQAANAELKQAHASLHDTRAALAHSHQQLNDTKAALDRVAGEREAAVSHVTTLESQLGAVDSELGVARSQLQSRAQELSSAQDMLSQMKDAADLLSVERERVQGEGDERLRAAQQKLAELERERSGLGEAHGALEAEKSALAAQMQQATQRWEQAQSEAQRVASELTLTEQQLAAERAESKGLREEISALRRQVVEQTGAESTERAVERQASRAEIERLQFEIEGLQSERKADGDRAHEALQAMADELELVRGAQVERGAQAERDRELEIATLKSDRAAVLRERDGQLAQLREALEVARAECDQARAELAAAREGGTEVDGLRQELQVLRDAHAIELQHASVRNDMLKREKARSADLQQQLLAVGRADAGSGVTRPPGRDSALPKGMLGASDKTVPAMVAVASPIPDGGKQHQLERADTRPSVAAGARRLAAAVVDVPAQSPVPARSPAQARPGARAPGKVTSYSVTAVQEEVVFGRRSRKPSRTED